MKRPILLGRAAVAALLFIACDGGLTGGGVNQPPLIVTASVERLVGARLRIQARAIDPDFDRLVLTYDQLGGPPTVERALRSIGGTLDALLDATNEGLYTFEIEAFDGLTRTSAELALEVDTNVDGGLIAAVSSFPQRQPPAGDFSVQIAGQVIADEGFTSFALPALLRIDVPGDSGEEVLLQQNAAAVELTTLSGTARTLSPPGGLDIVSQRDLFELLEVRYVGHTLILSSPVGSFVPPPGQFKSGEAALTGLAVVSTLMEISFAGERVTGEIFLSSQPVAPEALPELAEYRAQLNGTRR